MYDAFPRFYSVESRHVARSSNCNSSPTPDLSRFVELQFGNRPSMSQFSNWNSICVTGTGSSWIWNTRRCPLAASWRIAIRSNVSRCPRSPSPSPCLARFAAAAVPAAGVELGDVRQAVVPWLEAWHAVVAIVFDEYGQAVGGLCRGLGQELPGD